MLRSLYSPFCLTRYPVLTQKCLQSDLGDAQRRELGAAIEECAMLCMGPASVFDSKSGQSKPPGGPSASAGDEGSKMDEHVNRETIRRAGVHEAILTIFKGCFTQEGEGAPMIFALTGSDPAAVALRRDVLAPCMKFVTNFCSNFPPAQQELFPLVHLLLACMQQGVGATKAASAVLHGNEALCNKVPESVIHDVSAAIAKASEHGGQRPHHLAFLHGLCKRSGDKLVITRNTMLILKYLSNYGPIKISSPPAAIEKRSHGAKQGSKHGHREQMLVLFRGEEGRMLRTKLVADGDTSKSGGLLNYHLELLSLIQTMLLDHSSVAFSRIQIMLPPEKVCKDVTCPDTPIEAKAVLIDIMRTLYLSDEVRHKKHPLLGEAILDLLRHLVSQLSLVPLESLSRYHVPAKTGDNELVYLLTPHWAPLLLATLKHDVLGTSLSSELKNVGNQLVDRIVDLLNECNLEPKNAAIFLQVIGCAKQLQLSGASILSDKARQHASVSAGEVKASGAKNKSHKNSWSVAPRKLTELEMLHTFASVFLDSVDPLHVRPVGEDDDEGDDVVHRMELQKLCQSFHSTRQNARLDAELPVPKIGWTGALGRAPQVREFRSDEAIHLVHILRNYVKSSSAVGNDRVWNMVIGLSVLRVLAIEWRSSATEVEPPSWLLKGIPTLILDLMERPGADDRVVHKALELGTTATPLPATLPPHLCISFPGQHRQTRRCRILLFLLDARSDSSEVLHRRNFHPPRGQRLCAGELPLSFLAERGCSKVFLGATKQVTCLFTTCRSTTMPGPMFCSDFCFVNPEVSAEKMAESRFSFAGLGVEPKSLEAARCASRHSSARAERAQQPRWS